jgi:hypothetical protein
MNLTIIFDILIQDLKEESGKELLGKVKIYMIQLNMFISISCFDNGSLYNQKLY